MKEAEVRKQIRGQLIEARRRAKKKAHKFNIDENYIYFLYVRNNARCAMTRLKFSNNTAPSWCRRPRVFSIDRINSALGYIRGNVQLVIYQVNTAQNEWGTTSFDQMVCARYKVLQQQGMTSNEI